MPEVEHPDRRGEGLPPDFSTFNTVLSIIKMEQA